MNKKQKSVMERVFGSIGGMLFMVFLAHGCADHRPSPGQTSVAADDDKRFGLLTLQLTQETTARNGTVAVNGGAVFVRSRGMDRAEVLKAVGTPDYSDFSEFEAGQCNLVIRPLADVPLRDDGTRDVELLEAGDVSIETPENVVKLRSTYFPDLVPYISGVTYKVANSQRRPPAALRKQQKNTRIRATGSFDIPAFRADLDIDIPKTVTLVEVGGLSAAGGSVDTEPGRDLSVTWEPSGSPATLFLVEINQYSFDEVASIRCLVPDTGIFTIPEETLSSLPMWGSATKRLQVNRISIQPFDADGLDDGVFVLVAQDSVVLRDTSVP
ncbi:MAG: hypothetical protein HUU55_02750 [Myxococcales bacterium]|nr:hypothetical protein [Myxococcales bacterium]